MPVELRKRKAPAAPPAAAPPAKKKTSATKPAAAVAKAINGKKAAPAKANGTATTKAAPPSSKITVGSVISLDGFGGDIETQDGVKTTLKQLVEESKAGVVLFTYPKASTPGCTTQACLFRDSYIPLTATGLSIYGLSADSPKANTTFKTKQNLPYSLLCDPNGTLIGAIGFKKAPKSTTRAVFVIDKQGKVLAAQPGGPAATVEVVQKLVGEKGTSDDAKTKDKSEDVAKADVAADVADTAAKIDGDGAKA
ncbi:MAG: hypothetical protein M1838_006034 [Thelocarpon superellum]|nr:MAG: hypothetical protein M1838_006034 [Thelocarpon superellum]